jgi:thiamine pyrophosphate-dependent acetolactate synthase large subunit-like protein
MMRHRDALEVLAQHRGEHIVITTMGSVALWPEFSDTVRDFHYLPSSMGEAVPLALGLCLARPELKVTVLVGDGGLLMNLGCLVTTAQYAVPLRIILVDNGLYEVTGGQAVANSRRTDFARIAQGAGIPRVYTCATLDQWQQLAPEALSGPGPVFVWWQVDGEKGRTTPAPPRPMSEQIRRLQSLWLTTP